MSRTILVGVLAVGLLAWGQQCPGAEPPRTLSQVLPAEQEISLSIRQLNRLQTEGERLLAEQKLDSSFTLAQIASLALEYLGIGRLVDRDEPIVVVVPSARQLGLDEGEKDWGWFNNVVTRFQRRQTLEELAPLLERPADHPVIGRPTRVGERFLLPGEHAAMWLSRNQQVLRPLSQAAPLADRVAPAVAARIDRADIMLAVGGEEFREGWQTHGWEPLLRIQNGPGDDIPARAFSAVNEALTPLIDGVSFFAVTGAIEGSGLRIAGVAAIDAQHAGVVAQTLAAFQLPHRTSQIYYLPDQGTPMLALAITGRGKMARGLFEDAFEGGLAVKDWDNGQEAKALIDQALTHLLDPLEGFRLAIYEAPQEDRPSEYTAVAIADLPARTTLDAAAKWAERFNAFPENPWRLAVERPADEPDAAPIWRLRLSGALPELWESLLTQTLGRDWRSVSLAPSPDGQHLAVCWGSDSTLLEATLTNFREGRLGLARHPMFREGQQRLDAARLAEIHYSIRTPDADDSDAPTVVSGCVVANTEQVFADWWVPGPEAKAFLLQMGLYYRKASP